MPDDLVTSLFVRIDVQTDDDRKKLDDINTKAGEVLARHREMWARHGAAVQMWWAEQPKKFQEQDKNTQEWLGRAPGWIWASCTLASPQGHCMSLAVGVGGGQPGAAQEAPGAAQKHRGVAKRSSSGGWI